MKHPPRNVGMDFYQSLKSLLDGTNLVHLSDCSFDEDDKLKHSISCATEITTLRLNLRERDHEIQRLKESHSKLSSDL
ncbi:hypothetical protein V2J09_000639 [Rumex salicifolius]